MLFGEWGGGSEKRVVAAVVTALSGVLEGGLLCLLELVGLERSHLRAVLSAEEKAVAF